MDQQERPQPEYVKGMPQNIIPVHEYTIAEVPHFGVAVHKDGDLVLCHKMQPVLMTSQPSAIETNSQPQQFMMQPPCNLKCSRCLLCVEEAPDGKIVYIRQTCEPISSVFTLKQKFEEIFQQADASAKGQREKKEGQKARVIQFP